MFVLQREGPCAVTPIISCWKTVIGTCEEEHITEVTEFAFLDFAICLAGLMVCTQSNALILDAG